MKNQLAFFPTPYEDEDFKSLVYRYHIRSTNINILETIEELLNIKTHRVAHFPRSLNYLVARLPGNLCLTSDYFIANHTLLALFLPFLSVDENEKILGQFRSASERSEIGTRLLSPIVSTFVRYCPICLIQDFERLGECYIHRVHQYNFVAVCPDHRFKLVTHCLECSAPLSDSYGRFILMEPVCPNGHRLGDVTSVEPSARIQLFHEQLARDTKFIIDNVGKLNVELFKERMLRLCSHKGYLTSKGMYLNRNISKDFLGLFDTEMLKTVGISSIYLSSRTALKLLNFNGCLKNPLLHILGMEYMAQSVEGFVTNDTISPFGKGPWLCKNTYCPDYNTMIINQYKRKTCRTTQQFIGEFTCPSCGMIYSQTGAEFEDHKQEQKRVVFIGWRAAVIILVGYLNNVTPDYIFEELKVKPRQRKMIEHKVNYILESAKKSVLLDFLYKCRQAKSIEDVINWPEIHNIFVDYLSNPFGWMYGDKAKSRLEQDKAKLSECIKNLNDRDSIRRKVGESTYNWLMKRDPQWMNSVLPPREFNFKSLDWKQTDEEIVETLSRVVSETYFIPPKTRVQKYTILNKLTVRDKARIERFPEKLPRTVNFLEKSIESIESYQTRRIPDMIEQVRKSTWALTIDNVLKTPVLRGCSENVAEKVYHELMKQESSN
ncbi:MAG: TnsD family Tn7-like transposition protein [Desulfosporosinus sp.]|nr:TnsD family Tn7-like transposition protein [Desulfosporosinus sp.]